MAGRERDRRHHLDRVSTQFSGVLADEDEPWKVRIQPSLIVICLTLLYVFRTRKGSAREMSKSQRTSKSCSTEAIVSDLLSDEVKFDGIMSHMSQASWFPESNHGS